MRSALALAALAAVAYAQNQSLADALSADDELSTLTQYVTQAGLVEVLSSLSGVTILAPINSAFDDIDEESAVGQAIAANDTDVITALLQYHVLSGVANSSSITEVPQFIPSLLNNTAFTNVTGGQVVELVQVDNDTYQAISGDFTVSEITEADIVVGGITIHKIGTVLSIPGNISSTAVDAGLTSAAGALTQADLVETVDTAQNITVFVPNNDAFAAIASALNDTALVASVLQYHVVPGIYYSSNITNTTVPALAGGDITLSVVGDAVFVNSARVVIPNVLVANGVVHVIDGVLNPNATDTGDLDPEADPTPAYSGASSASDVPFTSGIEPTTTLQVPAVATEAPANSDAAAAASSSDIAFRAAPTAAAIGAGVLFAGAFLGM